jgi:formyltetrahydrofolate synthetase
MFVHIPSDMEIAQAAKPVTITRIAQWAGIAPDELERYGDTKAKVRPGYYGIDIDTGTGRVIGLS